MNYEDFYTLKLMTWEVMTLMKVNIRTLMRTLEVLEKFRYWLINNEYMYTLNND